MKFGLNSWQFNLQFPSDIFHENENFHYLALSKKSYLYELDWHKFGFDNKNSQFQLHAFAHMGHRRI
jgi:hypothetical protein